MAPFWSGVVVGAAGMVLAVVLFLMALALMVAAGRRAPAPPSVPRAAAPPSVR